MHLYSILRLRCDGFAERARHQHPPSSESTLRNHHDSTASIRSTTTLTFTHPSLVTSSSITSLRPQESLTSYPRSTTTITSTTSTTDTRHLRHYHPPSALDYTLKWNPEPLQSFATRDFTGETIAFLTYLAAWKQTWSLTRASAVFALPSERRATRTKTRRRQFNRALRIYAAFVSIRAECPLNLSSRVVIALEAVFDTAANVLFGAGTRVDRDVAPFIGGCQPSSNDQDHHGTGVGCGNTTAMAMSIADIAGDELVWYWGPIPALFNERVFDDAESEVRYLVLTNTWPRFVSASAGNDYRSGVGGSVLRRISRCFGVDGQRG